MFYINLIAAIQTFIFAFFVNYYNRKNIFNNLLGLLLIVLGIVLVGNSFVFLKFIPSKFLALFFITLGANVFVAPLISYYLNKLSGAKAPISPLLFFGSIGLFCYVLFLGSKYLGLTEVAQKDYFVILFSSKGGDKELFYFLLVSFLLQHVYFSFSWWRIYNFKELVKNVFSTKSRTRSIFAYNFITLLWVLDFLLLVSFIFFPIHIIQFKLYPIKILVNFCFAVYFILEQNVIFDENNFDDYLDDIALLNKAKENEDIVINDSGINAEKIKDFIEDKKLFLNPSLTIFDVANQMDCSHRLISSCINSELNITFSNLVNDYRVNEAKRLLKGNPKELTMEGIGLESGFNSRASFYRVFKQKTKCSPKEYLEKHIKTY